MNSLAAEGSGAGRKRRWGIGLALLIMCYIAAVVAFIVVY